MLLSSNMATEIEVEQLAEDHDYSLNLNRATFEQLCAPIFNECIRPLDQALRQANVQKG